jgi:hypothetical protein
VTNSTHLWAAGLSGRSCLTGSHFKQGCATLPLPGPLPNRHVGRRAPKPFGQALGSPRKVPLCRKSEWHGPSAFTRTKPANLSGAAYGFQTHPRTDVTSKSSLRKATARVGQPRTGWRSGKPSRCPPLAQLPNFSQSLRSSEKFGPLPCGREQPQARAASRTATSRLPMPRRAAMAARLCDRGFDLPVSHE